MDIWCKPTGKQLMGDMITWPPDECTDQTDQRTDTQTHVEIPFKKKTPRAVDQLYSLNN